VIQLHRINLTKLQLDQIPEAERRLFVLIAHAANELNALAKLFHFAASSASEEGLLAQAENGQAVILARIFAGKLYEFWQLLQTSFFGTALSKEYEPKLDAEAMESLKWLKRYFGRENLISTIRNQFAFHYSPDQIDAGYATVVDGDPLEIYLAPHSANTLYAFADTIANRAMHQAIQPGDHMAAFAAVIDQTSLASRNVNTIVGALMAVCFRKHIGASLYSIGADVVEVEGIPNSQKVAIPFFIEIESANDALQIVGADRDSP
jgi:hypothetical protein